MMPQLKHLLRAKPLLPRAQREKLQLKAKLPKAKLLRRKWPSSIWPKMSSIQRNM